MSSVPAIDEKPESKLAKLFKTVENFRSRKMYQNLTPKEMPAVKRHILTNQAEETREITVDFYGGFSPLVVPHDDSPLKAEAICEKAQGHLHDQMVACGMACGQSKAELATLTLPMFGLFNPRTGLWLSPAHEFSKTYACRNFVFRIRFCCPRSKIKLLMKEVDRATFKYLYLQCRDDFLTDRIKTVYKGEMEQRVMLGLVVMELVCPQNRNHHRSGSSRSIVYQKRAATTNGGRNGPTNTETCVSETSPSAIPGAAVNNENGNTLGEQHISLSEANRNLSFYSLRKHIPPSERLNFRNPLHYIRLYLSVKSNLRNFCSDYSDTPLDMLQLHYITGLLDYVSLYGLEKYKVQEVQDNGQLFPRNVLVKVFLPTYERGLYFEQKCVCKLSNIVKIEMTEEEVLINRRDGPNLILRFASVSEAESFVSMVSGWYRLEVDFYFSLCPKLEPQSLTVLKNLRCFGPFLKERVREILEKHLTETKPRVFLICQHLQHLNQYDVVHLNSSGQLLENQLTLHPDGMFEVFGTKDDGSMDDSIKRKFGKVQELLSHLRNTYGTYVRQDQPKANITNVFLKEVEIYEAYQQHDIEDEDGPIVKDPVIFDGSSIELGETSTIGNGRFTFVEKAKLFSKKDQQDYGYVAMKQLMANAVSRLPSLMAAMMDFHKMRSSSFLNFFGFLVSNPAKVCCIMEHAPEGNLEQYVMEKEPVNIMLMMSVALQIVQACSFLERHEMTHGNLRCRSIMIMNRSEQSMTVKVGDPGMVAAFNKKNIIDPVNMDRLPWLAMERLEESVVNDQVTIESEVFAYGTIVWELLTNGSRPHEVGVGLDQSQTKQIIEFYKRMRRLTCPESAQLCGDDSDHVKTVKQTLSEVVQNCWFVDPQARPTFDKILKDLHAVMGHAGRTGEIVPLQMDMICLERRRKLRSDQEVDQLMTQMSVDIDCIKYFENGKLGEGAFGRVQKATLYPPATNDEEMMEQKEGIVVAVKELTKSEMDSQKFRTEMMLVLKCSHPNIVKMVAVCTTPKMLMVMEFVEKGALLTYLQQNSSRIEQMISELVKISKEVAQGMEYLSSQKIIHRDLAARNILLTKDLSAKISDFGLSKITEKDYLRYEQATTQPLPWAWAAPECLGVNEIKFSEKSDVWSYGVMLWEVFSGGTKPSNHFKVSDPRQHYRNLEKGDRLPAPRKCPKHIYSIMQECWQLIPVRRPTFADLVQIFTKMHSGQTGEEDAADNPNSSLTSSA